MSRASLEKKPTEVAAMFDGIAPQYDLVNDLVSLGQARRWRRATVRAVGALPDDRVLDLGAGTGTSSEPLAAAGVEVVPCDLSLGMLMEGKGRRPDLPFIAGDATALPFADAAFDAVTISFALRNVVDADAALAEMLRVTRPGGRVVICEFSQPARAWFRRMYLGYLKRALPPVAGAVTGARDSYDYLAESIRAWPDQQALGRKLRRAGWSNVAYRNFTGGVVALHRAVRPAA